MAAAWYQVVRKRIAPIAIILAFGLLIFETCSKQERIDVRFVLDLGGASETVSRVEVDVLDAEGEPLSTFTRERDAAGVMGNPAFDAVLSEREATLAIRLHVPGRVIRAERRIVTDEGAVVTVALADEIGRAAP
jgi:hypothetical protein